MRGILEGGHPRRRASRDEGMGLQQEETAGVGMGLAGMTREQSLLEAGKLLWSK